MKANIPLSLTSLTLAFLLTAGCGGGGGSSTGTTTSPTGTTITVERGPVLHAHVADDTGMKATEIGNGQYRFDGTPVYPLHSYGGIIDINHNGTIDPDIDIPMDQLILTAPQGTVLSLVSTLGQNPELHAFLQSLGLNDTQIFETPPSQDKVVAAVSDELYRYCIENGISKPHLLTAAELERIRPQIQNRIQAYLNDAATTADLEQRLIETELTAHIDPISVSEVATLNATTDEVERFLTTLPVYPLTLTQKQTIAYMWDEERLARDLYRKLYELWPNARPLTNIAERSETKHVSWTQMLVEKYDLNLANTTDFSGGYDETVLAAKPAGEYYTPAVQQLYDALLAEGSLSEIDALKVGCKVEVTDINDLNADIATAGDALDLVAVYELLRKGSYNHYWAFDEALKQRGITEGCCSLGSDYCHPEYPRNTAAQQTQGGGTQGAFAGSNGNGPHTTTP